MERETETVTETERETETQREGETERQRQRERDSINGGDEGVHQRTASTTPAIHAETHTKAPTHAWMQISLLPRDSKADNDFAVSQANKLVQAGAVAMLGSFRSGPSAAVQSFLQRGTEVAQIGE